MKITCIIPTFNSEGPLKHCLDALLASTRKPDEIIVVDDASRDQTANLVKGYAEVDYIRLDQNSGPGAARNIGAIKASGDVFMFLDSDVEVSSNAVENLEKYFQNENIHIVSGIYDGCPSSSNFYTSYKSTYMKYIHQNLPETINFVLGALCAVRKEKFIKWPIDQRFAEDTLWAQSFLAKGLKVHSASNVQGRHLKFYDWQGFLKNEMNIASGFVTPWLSRPKGKTFSHVKNFQIASLIVSGLIFLSVISCAPLSFGIFFLVWLGLNKDLLFFLYNDLPHFPSIKIVLWTLVDNWFHLLGVIKGFAQTLLPPRERWGI